MLEVKNLTKIYRPKKGVPVKALNNVSLNIEDKGMVFILGKSGSGKSTLLNLLGGLDKYDAGEIIIKGKSSKNFTQAEFDSYRNTYLGFIFQEYNILDEFTVGANIALAMELQGKKADNNALNALLKQVDLDGLANRKPNELSGGQKQRIAIARALIKNPEIILADEPTGALDSKTGKQVFETLQKLSKDKLVLIVSHDREFAEFYGDRVIEMADGKVISDIKKYKAKSEQYNGISIIDDKILHIQKGYELTNEDLSLINSYLKKNESDTIISMDNKTNIDMKKMARIDDTGNRDAFKKTTPEDIITKDYSKSPFQLIKSKLNLKKAFKIGASGLKAKPIKLVVTILLSAIAFTLFGLADTIAAYNKVDAFIDSAEKADLNYVAITNRPYAGSDVIFDYEKIIENSKLKNESLVYNKFYGNEQFDLIDLNINSSFNNEFNQMYYFADGFKGFAEVSEENLLKYSTNGKLLCGNYPKENYEVVLPKYLFECYAAKGFKNSFDVVKKPEDMIGKKIYYDDSDKYIIVSGIIDTGFDKNEKFKKIFTDIINHKDADIFNTIALSEFEAFVTNSPHTTIFTQKDFVKNSYYYADSFNTSKYYNVDFNISDNYDTDPSYKVDSFININSKNELNIEYFGNYSKENFEDDNIIISLTSAVKLYNQNNSVPKLDFDDLENCKSILAKSNFSNYEVTLSNKTFRIAGYYINDLDDSYFAKYDAIVSENSLKEFINNEDNTTTLNPGMILAPMPSKSEFKTICNYLLTENQTRFLGPNYIINSDFSQTLNSANSALEEMATIFLYIGIGFVFFAGLLMASFITNSISYKKHEIGILRAIGARSSDVFKIFGSESFIIAIINWIIALFATLGASIGINNAISSKLPIMILNFNYRQILIILLCSLLTAFLASFFPVLRIARKKPIDAIRNK